MLEPRSAYINLQVCRRRNTSSPELGNRERNGLAHRTCSRWLVVEIPHSHHGIPRRSHREVGHLRHVLLQLVVPDSGKNAVRFINLGSIYLDITFPCCKLYLQQDDLVDHRSNSVRWYQHRSGAKLGNQLGHDQGLDSDNIAWLHFGQYWVCRMTQRMCGSLLSVVRGCGQPLDSWPGSVMSGTPVIESYWNRFVSCTWLFACEE